MTGTDAVGCRQWDSRPRLLGRAADDLQPGRKVAHWKRGKTRGSRGCGAFRFGAHDVLSGDQHPRSTGAALRIAASYTLGRYPYIVPSQRHTLLASSILELQFLWLKKICKRNSLGAREGNLKAGGNKHRLSPDSTGSKGSELGLIERHCASGVGIPRKPRSDAGLDSATYHSTPTHCTSLIRMGRHTVLVFRTVLGDADWIARLIFFSRTSQVYPSSRSLATTTDPTRYTRPSNTLNLDTPIANTTEKYPGLTP